MRVLIAEDEPDMAQAIRDGLRPGEIARCIVPSGSGMPILMLTAADRLDDKASGFGLRVGYRIDTQPETGAEGGKDRE